MRGTMRRLITWSLLAATMAFAMSSSSMLRWKKSAQARMDREPVASSTSLAWNPSFKARATSSLKAASSFSAFWGA